MVNAVLLSTTIHSQSTRKIVRGADGCDPSAVREQINSVTYDSKDVTKVLCQFVLLTSQCLVGSLRSVVNKTKSGTAIDRRYKTKVQLIKRPKSKQSYVNFQAALPCADNGVHCR